MALQNDINILLDVLGNETRRRILQLLAHEPRYLLQLADQLDVSQQGILKHLTLLERYGLISSYSAESELPAPPRKYYKLATSVYLAIQMTKDSVGFKVREIPSLEEEGNPISEAAKALPSALSDLEQKVTRLEEVDYAKDVLEASNDIIRDMNDRLEDLESIGVHLLRLRQRVVYRAHQAIRDGLSTDLERRILYHILGASGSPDVEALSEELDVREKEIRQAIQELQRRLDFRLTKEA